MKKRIIFMGTPEFAAHILKELIKIDLYDIILCVSQPDRPFGRKKELKQSEVKVVAQEFNIEVFQPENIKIEYDRIVDLKPDIIITAAYGQIVPSQVLEAPNTLCINVHGSMLPAYRGGAPIHYSVLDGLDKTGVTVMEMVQKMDAGDIISQSVVNIDINDTTQIVYDNMKQIGAELLIKTLPTIFDNTYTKTAQDESLVTYSPNIAKELEHVAFDRPALKVHNHIRGLVSFPVGHMFIDDMRIKLFKSELTDIKSTTPNTIYKFDKTGLYINCSDVVIKIVEFQIAGKKKMSLEQYINGNVDINKNSKLH